MSKLTKGIRDTAGGAILGNIFGPQGAIVGGALQVGAPGQTGQPGGGQIQFSPEANSRAQQIFQAIQGNQAGTYHEGQIATANSELKKLQQEFQSGKISQADYVAITGAVVPQITDYIHQISASGSRGADAIRNAGGDEFLNGVGRQYDVYSAGNELLGRELTPQEAAQFAPYFQGGTENGRAALAQYAQQDKNSPQSLQKRAGQYSGDVNRLFGQDLGRTANQDESDYYGRLIASGLSPYEVESYIKQLPEYTNTQDKNFRSGLNDELAGYDQQAFGKAKEDVLSRYASAGIQNSSALDFALTNLMGDIAKERGKYLAGVSTQQYGSNKDAARSDYQSSLDNYLKDRNYNQQRSDSLLDNYQKRSYDVSDYNRQMQDLFNYQNNQPRQKTSPFDYLNAGLNTVNTGANLYKSIYPYG
jgi:hypothetical protein